MPNSPHSDSTEHAYKYTLLSQDRQEIRLLRLLPDARDKPIRAELETVSLASNSFLDYETISYVWGDPTKSVWIDVLGKKLAVPVNTAAALRRVRLTDRTRTVWIDAVCINQNDTEERSRQVGLMGRVYSGPRKNLIHLDDSNAMAERVVKLVAEADEDCRAATNNYKDFRAMIYDEDTGNANFLPSTPFSDWDKEAVQYLVSRPWFRRLWVVQEARLAPFAVCYIGDIQIGLINLLRASRWLEYTHTPAWTEAPGPAAQHGRRCMTEMYDLVDPDGPSSGKASLGELLTSGQRYEKTDPRDSVYGILGMLEHIPSELRPDYSAGLGTVLRTATYRVMHESNALDILRSVHHRENCPASPYIPTWAFRADKTFSLADPHDLGRGNNAAKGLDAPTMLRSPVASPTRILLQALKVDEVQAMTVPCPIHASHLAKWNWVILSLKHLHEHSRGFRRCLAADAEGLALNLLHTLRAGRLPHASETTHANDIFITRQLLTYIREAEIGPVLQKEPREFRETIRLNNYFQALRCRRLLFTECEKFGLGPATTELGDIVVIARGGHEPFVLRRTLAHYHFKGAAYVEGIMHGEAVKACKARGEGEQIFIVC